MEEEIMVVAPEKISRADVEECVAVESGKRRLFDDGDFLPAWLSAQKQATHAPRFGECNVPTFSAPNAPLALQNSRQQAQTLVATRSK
jgi:hypothetical protein